MTQEMRRLLEEYVLNSHAVSREDYRIIGRLGWCAGFHAALIVLSNFVPSKSVDAAISELERVEREQRDLALRFAKRRAELN